MGLFNRYVLAVVVGVQCCCVMPLAAADHFYKNKTVSIVVGFTPGGTYDSFARTIARHMGRYIEDEPAVVVQNMPGAGSLTAVRYLDGAAPVDGTVIATFNQTTVTQSILDPTTINIDFRHLAWLGSGSEELRVCFIWHTKGDAQWQDIAQRKEFVVGATSIGTANYMNGMLLKNMFGLHIKQILGYPGKNEQLIAIERGELDGGCSEWASVPDHWFRDKLALPFVSWLPTLPKDAPQDIPYIGNYTRTDDDRKILDLLVSPSSLGNPFVMSQKVPQARLHMMETALAKTLADPAFLKDSEILHLNVMPKSSEEVQHVLAKIYQAATTELIAKTNEMIK